ncbi:energy transducer TonB [Bizionia sp. KMM 8389]
MNFLNKKHEGTLPCASARNTGDKHAVNLQKNATIYFQVGLIICLLFAYGLLEMQFETVKQSEPALVLAAEPNPDLTVVNYQVYKEPIKELVPQKQAPRNSGSLQVVKNSSNQTESPDTFLNEEPKADEGDLDPNAIHFEPLPEEPVNIMLVEQVPVFPGCESAETNDERRACLNAQVANFVKEKFDTDKSVNLGLKGKQKIYVNFKITAQGTIEILQTRAPHRLLEEEANRTINKLPKMVPARHGAKNVPVLYTLPIVFQVTN